MSLYNGQFQIYCINPERKNSLVHLRVLLITIFKAKSELHVYNETPNLVKTMLMSLTELYLQQIKFHAETTPVLECFYEDVLAPNIEENPTAHATFS